LGLEFSFWSAGEQRACTWAHYLTEGASIVAMHPISICFIAQALTLSISRISPGRRMSTSFKLAAIVAAILTSTRVRAESLWIEAEHLSGVQGYCWPMGKPEMKQTKGAWGISGPGWAAEWNQGG